MDNIVQGTPEWLKARAGKITASRVSALMAKTKSGWSTSRNNMITQLAIERITGYIDDGYQNSAMRRGVELEQEARDAYAFEYGLAVREQGICVHAKWDFVTCSPDGLVGDDGLVEIKCPFAMAKHYEALQTGAHAKEYHWQIHHQMLVTGRRWVDAVSYDPRYPAGLQLAVKRVHANAEIAEELMASIIECNDQIERQVAEMRKLQSLKERAE